MLDQALITTVERHLLEHKGQNPHATEEFSWLMSGITLATKTIAAQIQRAGLLDIIGRTGQVLSATLHVIKAMKSSFGFASAL